MALHAGELQTLSIFELLEHIVSEVSLLSLFIVHYFPSFDHAERILLKHICLLRHLCGRTTYEWIVYDADTQCLIVHIFSF